MDIKKYTFDVLSAEDMTRSFAGCLLNYRGSIIRVNECYVGSAGAMSCVGSRVRVYPEHNLLGPDFRLGANQMRALLDPVNLLPAIRSGHVNIVDPDDGVLRGDLSFVRKVGGYVRGYGIRSVLCNSVSVLESVAYQGSRVVTSEERILRVLHAAFSGGNYVSPEEARSILLRTKLQRIIALSPNVLMQHWGDGVRVMVVRGRGAFTCAVGDDGVLRFDPNSNAECTSDTKDGYIRIISRVMPCQR